jgi:transcriptional regulator with XRE-family HTH domain
MTLRELAEKAGVRHPSIAQYEAGKGLPGQGNLAKLVSVLGTEWLA